MTESRDASTVHAREGSGSKARGVGLRIAGFYALLGLLIFIGVRYLPALENLILLADITPDTNAPADAITSTMAGGTPLQGAIPTGWDSVWVTGASVLGALIIMLPVAWTYILIKRDAGYEESVVHTLLILPVAVAGIVTIVQGSLALAFSLAGIVAAVRFRTTLDDTKDAVYVFLAIGVGLAAGVQALGVALALSVVFNAVNLVLWKLNFGDIYADRLHRTGGLGLGTVIAGPSSGRSAVGYGDRAHDASLAPSSVEQIRAQQARIHAALRRESSKKKERKRYLALLVYTRDPEAVHELVPPILAELAERFRLAEGFEPNAEGVHALTWLVKLQDGVSTGALVTAVREADDESWIEGAEVRSLREVANDS
ncbi:MAG TPA: DUF4956 domain-containing protein [Longimicrobiales bacterium]|nr:DUF4956 domain-containing protein [Longimicrobiales bacterium]